MERQGGIVHQELYRLNWSPNTETGFGFTIDVSTDFLKAGQELGKRVSPESLNKLFALTLEGMGMKHRIMPSRLFIPDKFGYSGTQLLEDETALYLAKDSDLTRGGNYYTHNVDTASEFVALFNIFDYWADSVKGYMKEQGQIARAPFNSHMV